jgi:hypothetical protein
MERKKKLFQTLNCIILVIMVITTASHSLCFANTSPSPDSKMSVAFSDSMDSESGDNVKDFLEEKGLEIDLENGLTTIVLGREISIVPLISTDFHQMTTPKESHQESQFLAYINHEMLGRFMVFLEVIKDPQDEMLSSIKIIFPSGRGLILGINPFYIYQIDPSHTGISLQDKDDLKNTIIVSDTCDTLWIIATVLTTACGIFPDPILCAIATAMETVHQFLCL